MMRSNTLSPQRLDAIKAAMQGAMPGLYMINVSEPEHEVTLSDFMSQLFGTRNASTESEAQDAAADNGYGDQDRARNSGAGVRLDPSADNRNGESERSRFGFDTALQCLEIGHRLERSGWNGKGMFLYHVPANAYPPTTPAGATLARKSDGLVPYGAYIAMKTATGEVVPWLASQTDLLAKDWQITL